MKASRFVLGGLGAVALVAGSLMVGVNAAGANGPDGLWRFNAGMNGDREVPGPADDNASGHAVVTVDLASGQICWQLTVRNVDGTIVAAHIHAADRDHPGPVVQPLTAPTTGESSGCATNTALAAALVADPSSYYVNVHSTVFPAGALRGQLAGPHS